MAVRPEDVKNRIQDLIAEMNARTGVLDTNLSDAINSLKEGWSDIPGEHFYINGALKQYAVKAGASVAAGDFVEFVREWGGGEVNDYAGYDVMVVPLDDSRAVVINTISLNSSYYGYAVVVSTDGASTTLGTPVRIYTADTAGLGGASAVAMAPDRILVVHQYRTVGKIVHLKVDGMVITKVSEVEIAGLAPYSITRLNSTEALLAYSGGKAVKITHASNTAAITVGTVATFDSSASGKVKAVTLRDGQAMIIYGVSSYCKAIAVNTSTNPVTFGSSAVVESSQAPTYLAATAMSPREVLALCDVGTGHAKVYQLVVSGTTISTSDTEYLHGGQSGRWLYVAPLTPSKALAVGEFNDGTKVETRAMVVTLGGTAVTIGTSAVIDTNTTWSTTPADLVTLSESSALFAYSKSGSTRYRGLTIDGTTVTVAAAEAPGGTTVKKANSNSDIVGIAKTSGSAGVTIDVYRAVN